MSTFKKLISGLLLAMPLSLMAAGGGVKLDHANIDMDNTASLQRGFKYFSNYCMGCHSAAYSRYNRVAADLEIPEDVVTENMIFTRDEKGETDKIGALMKIAMPKLYSKEAFGVAPPDLTLTARSRSPDWLYSYLRGFYLDPSRPYGVNNTVFPDVGMPHVLWELQGWQVKKEHGEDDHGAPEFELVEQGSMSPAEYDQAVRDLVGFMEYVAEPVQGKRKSIGFMVILFLMLFSVVAYFMKKEFWKDVH